MLARSNMSFHIDLNDIQHTYVDDIASLSPRSHQSDGSYYPLEDQRRNRLCVEILDLISNSVMTFRPSQSLASLDCLEPTSAPAIEIDIVISGGGLKGYFMTGCSHILKRELQKQNVKIARIAGASAGAWCALFMLTNLDTENWIETYYLCKERPDMTMHEAYDDIWPWLNSHLPENAWQLCSGRLFISVTEVTLFGLRNHMISEYTSNRDIFEACLASSTVPYLSLPQCFRLYRGMYVLDGGVTNNTPIFPDNARRQLIFRLSDVFYPVRFLINPHGNIITLSNCHELLGFLIYFIISIFNVQIFVLSLWLFVEQY